MIAAERKSRQMLVAGPIVAAIGIALTASLPDKFTMVGGVILFSGFVTAVWGTHLYGRLGVDHGESE
jgi:hypothetical protein